MISPRRSGSINRSCSISPRRTSSCRPRPRRRSRPRSRAIPKSRSIPIPAWITPSPASAASIMTKPKPQLPIREPLISFNAPLRHNRRTLSMPHAIRFHQAGGPEVLRWEEVTVAKPGPGEARIRHTAVGLNYIDTYHRSGLYPLPLPSVLGSEGAGVVEEVGPGVSDLKRGDRVAYAGGPVGSYAEERLIPADKLVPLPAGISDTEAAAMMLKGMTAQYLLRRTYRVKAGDTILFHAAAGGVGLIACQWAKHLGATVIGTVSSEDKAKLAKAHGYDHVINY